ncbi:hypothetical protein BC828DRAFT_393127 [Blastocladiella britannica]|nr:hypothetical protein BC828DRAFT_393127 [Blastocladiella britannica]
MTANTRISTMAAATLALLLLAVPIHGFGSLCRSSHTLDPMTRAGPLSTTPPDTTKATRIAFLGDQGLTLDSATLLTHIREWGPHAVVHLGDLDYKDDPVAWDSQINATLGERVPYLVAIGNHDVPRWSGPGGYAEVIARRIAAAERDTHGQVSCHGEIGANVLCNVHGIELVVNGVGTFGQGHVEFVQETLGKSGATWKVCAWHKNQRAYQPGAKIDETGYAIYDACRAAGAIVATAHEHAYSRTHVMASFADQLLANASDPATLPLRSNHPSPPHANLTIQPGRTFAFVSGLGGESVRSAYWPEIAQRPWLAAVATADTPDVRAGAVLCEFGARGDPQRAECEFVDAVNGIVFDRFTITSRPDAAPPAIAKMLTAAGTNGSPTCRRDTIDVPLRHVAHRGPKRINLARGQGVGPVRFEFEVPRLAAGSKVAAAHLQLMGAPSALRNAAVASGARPEQMVLQVAAHRPSSGPMGLLSKLGQSVMHWTLWKPALAPPTAWASDEWEANEVWVSPNLYQSETVTGGGLVEVEVSATGAAAAGLGEVYVGERGGCLAPSLMLHIDVCE